jgi:GT2 family glycosyltransferase
VFEQVGGFDEDFFAYADDADLGIRFRLAGWRCVLAADAVVEHRHSATLGAYSPRKLYLVERNRIWLAAKYFPWPLLLLNPLLWLSRTMLTAAALAGGSGPFASIHPGDRRAVLAAILRAQWDGWRAVPSQRRKRARLADQCGDRWGSRLTRLLRVERAPLHQLAYGRLR